MCGDKQSLRAQMLYARRQESLDIRKARAEKIAQSLFALTEFQAAQTIFCYCSTSDEIGTDCILDYALQQKKTVCVPTCESHGIMHARIITSRADLFPGKFGIREPKVDAPFVAPSQIDLCIAPCLCADQDGYRLGYGGGYYDRFLAQSDAYVIALCADSRFFSQPLPRESTDVPCHCILTERQVYRC